MSWFRNIRGDAKAVAQAIEKTADEVYGDIQKAVVKVETELVNEIDRIIPGAKVHIHSDGHFDEATGRYAIIRVHAGPTDSSLKPTEQQILERAKEVTSVPIEPTAQPESK